MYKDYDYYNVDNGLKKNDQGKPSSISYEISYKDYSIENYEATRKNEPELCQLNENISTRF